MFEFLILVFLTTTHGQQTTMSTDLDLILEGVFASKDNKSLSEIRQGGITGGSATHTLQTTTRDKVLTSTAYPIETLGPETNQKNQNFNQTVFNQSVPVQAYTEVFNQTTTNLPTTESNSSCFSFDVEAGTCTPYDLCDDIIDDDNFMDFRGLHPCPTFSYLHVCCANPRNVSKINTTTLAGQKSCGRLNPKNDGSNENEFYPWVVSVHKSEAENKSESANGNLTIFGGTLIHPSVVLTAAHVLTNKQKVHVRAGRRDSKDGVGQSYQERDVTEIVVHEHFNNGTLFNDVALLFLSEPFILSQEVGLACLPAAREQAENGSRCQASVWKKENGQVKLQNVELPVVDRHSCEDRLRKTRLGRYFNLHSSFMCAGGEDGIDTCKGDGGAPLICPVQNEHNRFVQNGIVAWGIGCGENGIPGVYVDIASLHIWIDNSVARRGYETTTYTL